MPATAPFIPFRLLINTEPPFLENKVPIEEFQL